MLNHFSHAQLFVTPWTVVTQAPLSMEFSRQKYWSELPCPPTVDLPDPGIESVSPALADGFFTTEPPGKSINADFKIPSNKLFYALNFISKGRH